MGFWGLILIAIACVILIKVVKKRREQALVEQLKEIRKRRSPAEALIAVDNAIHTNRHEGDIVEKTSWIWRLWR